jgi:SP family myo-inositol transporter-like MFS transporter 13
MAPQDDIDVTGQQSRRQSVVQAWHEKVEHSQHVDALIIEAENEDKMTPYLAFLVLSAALGGFLYGYDTGVVGVALPYVGTELTGEELTYSQQEIATAATTIGSIFGAAILGFFAVRKHRRGTWL